MLTILAGSLSLVPQLALQQRVAVPLAGGGRSARAVSPQAALTTDEKIVPRDVLFGNPEYASPMLSPDGKLLAYLRPDDGVMNVWCRTVGKSDDRVVTIDTQRARPLELVDFKLGGVLEDGRVSRAVFEHLVE